MIPSNKYLTMFSKTHWFLSQLTGIRWTSNLVNFRVMEWCDNLKYTLHSVTALATVLFIYLNAIDIPVCLSGVHLSSAVFFAIELVCFVWKQNSAARQKKSLWTVSLSLIHFWVGIRDVCIFVSKICPPSPVSPNIIKIHEMQNKYYLFQP